MINNNRDGHQQWPDYQLSTNFPKTSKGQQKPENEEEEQLNIFQHSIQSKEEVRKNQFYKLLKRNQQIS